MNCEIKVQNYSMTTQIEKSCIKFNKKINSSQRYGVASYYTILYKVVQRLSQHNLNNSNHPHVENLRQRK
jgi:hypothetical protein